MRVAFHTLGCKVNSYETQGMLEQFRELGYEVVEFTDPSDVYVINTCSVTQMAEHKSRQMINRARALNENALVVATGCYAQEDAEGIAEATSVDMVVGNNHKSEIAQIVAGKLAYRNEMSQEILVDDLTKCRDFESQIVTTPEKNVRAYIKIQDGCDRFCSYCIIPYVRGRSRSRSGREIIDEVKGLAKNGFREVVLTGIDISTFKPEDVEDESPIAWLIERLDAIDGIERVRLGSLEVSMVTDDFVTRTSVCRSFCPQFHLSLQSGSDTVLKRMNRKYTSEQYYQATELLRKYFEDPAITTDIIVGFPGETEEEYQETLRFAEKIRFSRVHVFKYSSRKGTLAAKMPNQVPSKVKSSRSAELIALTEGLRREYEDARIGKNVDVLIEEEVKAEDGHNVFVGYTPEYIRVAVQQELAPRINDIITVIPTDHISVSGENILI